LFAVIVGEVATPELSVLTTAVATAPVNVADAPDAGAENVTAACATVLPNASFTTAFNGFAKAVFLGAFCPDPLTAVIDEGGPGLLVRVNVAGANGARTVAAAVTE